MDKNNYFLYFAGSRACGHDVGPDLLPEEIFRGKRKN
jgi:hypothetical protein